MDLAARCRLEAERCRRLAAVLGDDPAGKTLMTMAVEYDTEARRQERAQDGDEAASAG